MENISTYIPNCSIITLGTTQFFQILAKAGFNLHRQNILAGSISGHMRFLLLSQLVFIGFRVAVKTPNG
jgi:hypothetical protein